MKLKLPHIIKRGDRGAAVKWVQDRLIVHLGASCLPRYGADGDAGEEFDAAVRRFQRLKKLEVDGVAGPATQTALKAARGATVPTQPKPRPTVQPVPGKRTPAMLACDIMGDWVGRSESPAGSNKVPHLVRLAKRRGWSDSVSEMGFSWCDFALHLALDMAGSELGELVSGTWGGYTGAYCPSTQNLLEEWVRLGKAERVSASRARYGDICLFDWQADGTEDHISFARARARGGDIRTRECNTSAGSIGSQSNGDGCYDRLRPVSVISSIYRIIT